MVRLLLVDGCAVHLHALERALEGDAGFRVVLRAGSLAGAIEAIATAAEAPNVALVGDTLPDGEGVELRTHLHAYFPGCHLALYGARHSARELARAMAYGVAGLFPVTASFAELTAGVARLAANEPLIPHGERAALLRDASRLVAEERASRAAMQRLTPREREILQLLAGGMSDKEIAARLKVSVKTVAAHMTSLLDKFKVDSRLQAVLLALRYRLIELP